MTEYCTGHETGDVCQRCGWGVCRFCGHECHDGECCKNCPIGSICGDDEEDDDEE